MPVLPIDSGRYGSEEMREIFEESRKLSYMLRVEGEVARAQAELGLIPKGAGEEIFEKANTRFVKLERCKELERLTRHETASVVLALEEVCSDEAKPWVHYGLTSNDLLDTSTSLQLKDALAIVRRRMVELLKSLIEKARAYSKLPSVGRTHGQHASVMPFGLKFSVWASELIAQLELLDRLRDRVLLCKTLGAVGTGSIMGEKAVEVEELVSKRLGLNPVKAATQVIPRERYAELIFFSALVGSTLDRIATEVRNLQRTEIGEVEEPFLEGQVGSSALPIKRNPIRSERVSSLARLLRGLVQVALENVSLWHERDLTNSANERFTLPLSMILLDEMLSTTHYVVSNLKVDEGRVRRNLELTRGLVYSEFVLKWLLRKGLPRSKAYGLLQRAAFRAMERGTSYREEIRRDAELSKYLSEEELDEAFDAERCFSASKRIMDEVEREALSLIEVDEPLED